MLSCLGSNGRHLLPPDELRVTYLIAMLIGAFEDPILFSDAFWPTHDPFDGKTSLLTSQIGGSSITFFRAQTNSCREHFVT
jgi:hypothetical protein